MKRKIISSLLGVLTFLTLLPTGFVDNVSACTYVDSYSRKDGTRVSGYFRGCGESDEEFQKHVEEEKRKFDEQVQQQIEKDRQEIKEAMRKYEEEQEQQHKKIEEEIRKDREKREQQRREEEKRELEKQVNRTPSYNLPFSLSTPKIDTITYKSKVVNLYRGKQYAGTKNANELVKVKGYYREDGTYVRPHYRTYSNSVLTDNLSYLGLSTLLPLDKTRLYLNTVVEGKNLNSYQHEKFENYATKLTNNQDKPGNVFLEGKSFYQNLGFGESFAEKQANYDVFQEMDYESYIYSVLMMMGINEVNDQEQKELKKYSSALQDKKSQTDEEVILQGKYFYSLIGVSQEVIDIQIQMDLLQNQEMWAEEKKKGSNPTQQPVPASQSGGGSVDDLKSADEMGIPVINDIGVSINGTTVSMSPAPIIVNGTTFIPLRGVFEKLNAKVEWEAITRSVIVTKGKTKVEVTIGSKNAYVNGKSMTLTQVPFIRNGSTFIPLRFISESIGAKVSWDESKHIVGIEVN
ncbi:copper amine oxidase-like protein [Aneurinibacillus soli]|uniref:Copper amine oxidase-like N-terminal domain-containing protein n=1 Tax=Aneurinibacillus soli TaxID=1500254 RepID=A0A0U5AZ25_9BACL|nr:stalk domain-containing protein [Aneurinibacillus soli]PYE62948.1 copper amine oxidase-like protein [Aneurinibacillus soli]BAU28993.1 hypothetical protein CB4_03171 [Aneurinibacillus soli]